MTNFLIGRGELLTGDIKGPRGGAPKAEVYSFVETRARLHGAFQKVSQEVNDLPADACPGDLVVVSLIMNPSYIAKSYFPSSVLRATGLTSVGSRTVKVKPQKWSKKVPVQECTTTEIFVAGNRTVIQALPNWIETLVEGSHEALDAAHIEDFNSVQADSKIRIFTDEEKKYFEIGLHLLPGEDDMIQRSFAKYADKIGVKLYRELEFFAGNLWFIPVEASNAQIHALSIFTFVRVARPVPPLRSIGKIQRVSTVPIACSLPTAQPLSSLPRVAILDGGLPQQHLVSPWLRNYHQGDPTAEDDPDSLQHGLAVSSAFLFGPISPRSEANRPYSYFDHFRVLDKATSQENPLELYRTLGFIEEILLSRQYEFINLSLGPDLPIEDTDVHAWTSVIDELLSDGSTFMSIAIGNNGELDRVSGNARVQVPSDCVNAISVGACDDVQETWNRSSYSAIGPGRSPGVIKPDLVSYGGGDDKYFHVLSPGTTSQLLPVQGTSFSSPYLLRNAVGVRAILGDGLSPLAIKSLLIHSANNPQDHHRFEVGWGKIPENIYDTITCPSGVARIVYQGELKPGKYLRAALPLPEGGLQGNIKLKATFCYACPVDPQDASSYTTAGLDIYFRPDVNRIEEGQQDPDTRTFFQMKHYSSEAEQRSDHGKWETVMHDVTNMRGSSLDQACFDIHYNAREGGRATRTAGRIPYALVITIEAPRHPELYNDILRAYTNVLVPIEPQVSIPIRADV